MSPTHDPSGPIELATRWAATPDDLQLELDVLRGELYRALDELARAARPDRERLIEAFEGLWERFKTGTRGR